MRKLVAAYRNVSCAVNEYVGGHKHRVSEKAVYGHVRLQRGFVGIFSVRFRQLSGYSFRFLHLVFLSLVFLRVKFAQLFLERRIPEQPAYRRYHAEQQKQLCVCLYIRLSEENAFFRVQTDSYPVQYHVARIAGYSGAFVLGAGGQYVPVRGEEIAVVFVLQFYPVAQRAPVIPEMQSACRSRAGNYNFFFKSIVIVHNFIFSNLSSSFQIYLRLFKKAQAPAAGLCRTAGRE